MAAPAHFLNFASGVRHNRQSTIKKTVSGRKRFDLGKINNYRFPTLELPRSGSKGLISGFQKATPNQQSYIAFYQNQVAVSRSN